MSVAPSTITPSESVSQVAKKNEAAAPAPVAETPKKKKRGGKRGDKSVGGDAQSRASVTGTPKPTQLGGKPTELKNDPLWDTNFETDMVGCMSLKTTRSRVTLSASGYMDVVRSTYQTIAAASSAFQNDVPFCLYQYYCVEAWWARVVAIGKSQADAWNNPDAERFLDSVRQFDLLLPEPVRKVLAGMGSIVDPSGDSWYISTAFAGDLRPATTALNVPGHFGKMKDENVWKYIDTPAPGISVALVMKTIEQNSPGGTPGQSWQLPGLLDSAPTGETNVLTPNLLGYHLPERLTKKQLARLDGLGFTSTQGPSQMWSNRFAIHGASLQLVRESLAGLGDKFAMGRIDQTNVSGSLGQLTHNEISPDQVIDERMKFTLGLGSIASRFRLDPSVSGGCFLASYRQERVDNHDGRRPWVPFYRMDAQRAITYPAICVVANANQGFNAREGPIVNAVRFITAEASREVFLPAVTRRFIKS